MQALITKDKITEISYIIDEFSKNFGFISTKFHSAIPVENPFLSALWKDNDLRKQRKI